ncbi:MAG: hypothetical protein WCT04_13045 [Planctomycetota bacterium]
MDDPNLRFTEHDAVLARTRLPNLRILAGSLLFGLVIPYFLVGLRNFHSLGIEDRWLEFKASKNLEGIKAIPIILPYFCGGTVIVSLWLLRAIFKWCETWTASETIKISPAYGAFMNFFNLPLYFALYYLKDEPWYGIRMVLLIVISGALNGLWIGWHAWRAWHPEEHFFPRFSLQTLMIAVFIWGAIMVVFQPR